MLDIPGFHFSPVGLVIDDWVDFETWEQGGRALKIAGAAIQWYLGDWLQHGEHKWGEKYAQVVDANERTGIPIKTLRDYQWVAEKVPIAVRTAKLDWTIHRAVAVLPTPKQKDVLKKVSAEPEKWTKRTVERYVQTGLEPGEKSDINASALAAPAIAAIESNPDLTGDKSMVEFLQETRAVFDDLKAKCPRAKFTADVIDGWIEEVDEHLEQLALSVLKEKVVKAWKDGYRQELQIASVTGIPNGEIHGVMMAYKREGIFERIVRSKVKMAKGTPPWIWHLKGEPLGSYYQPGN